MRGILFCGFLTLFAAGVACSGSQEVDQDASQVSIVGGQVASPTEFPSVIKMTVDPGSESTAPKICTGVIISHRTVLAAAHCIKQRATGKNSYHFIEIEAGATRAKIAAKVSYAYTYKEPLGKDTIPDNHVALDLAVMDFGQNTFNLASYPKIATRTQQKGSAVTLVGFGATSFNTESKNISDGSLNFGYNSISEAGTNTGYIKVSGVLGANGLPQGALAAPGDSGGPLFNEAGELVGIGSGLSIVGNRVENYYVDLTSRESKVLIGRYLQQFGGTTSALIPGFTADLGQEFSAMGPRTTTSQLTLIAMCGGKGKQGGDKGSGTSPSDDDAEGTLSSSKDNFASQFGTGNGAPNPGLSGTGIPGPNGSGTDAAANKGVTTEIGSPEPDSAGTQVVTP
jgi:V8-like Glu-specific endopeptidase